MRSLKRFDTTIPDQVEFRRIALAHNEQALVQGSAPERYLAASATGLLACTTSLGCDLQSTENQKISSRDCHTQSATDALNENFTANEKKCLITKPD